MLFRVELDQLFDSPRAVPHDRFHQGGDLLEQVQGILGAGELGQMRVAVYERVQFRHRGGGGGGGLLAKSSWTARCVMKERNKVETRVVDGSEGLG